MKNELYSNFVDKYFINPAIEHGIKAYINYKKHGEFVRTHTFEMHVIKALTIIYGEKTILLPYKIDNEKAFKCNLLIYDLKESDMQSFIKHMNSYNEFIKNIKAGAKATEIVSEIERILIEMMNKRSRKHPFTETEFNELDSIFNPLNGDLKRIKNILVNDNSDLVRNWYTKKEELSNTQIRLMAINPNLLNPSEYANFGYDIKEVATHTEEEIIKINNEILKAEFSMVNKPLIAKSRRKRKITTGNVYLDTLIAMGMISTVVMAVFIIVKQLGGQL